MQALFQLDVQGSSLLPDLDDFFREYAPDELNVRTLASDWTRGAWTNITACDELITAAAIKWKLSRLSQVDKSILRLSVYHLKFCGDIPPKVTIMAASAKEFYAKTVRTLPPKERLRLAAMILNDLTSSTEGVELSDSWSDEDMKDLSTFALSHGENPHEPKKKKNSRSR
jgi:N utilization substance protein B